MRLCHNATPTNVSLIQTGPIGSYEANAEAEWKPQAQGIGLSVFSQISEDGGTL